ncbi:rCG47283 [Rattus norvegicus]|uniref:RCG47283 n=1 Tax=Rattus norvegicus TaxID=10116 RepID=A6I0G9_RAT|nr:rCG47283 [Rattus norvegicus]
MLLFQRKANTHQLNSSNQEFL